jgi:replicative DNA helicase
MSTTRRSDAPPRRPLTELVDRKLPSDLEAETNLLGSIILLPDVLDDVIPIVRPDDFFDDAHRKLYTHLCELHESSKRIDVTILSDRLKSAGDFESIGGAAYLGRIINSVPNAAHAVFYAEIVQAKSTYRAMITAATEIVRDAYDETREAPNLLNEAEHKIFSILDDRSNTKVLPLSEVVHEALSRLDARMKGTHVTSCGYYGFESLDAKTAGMHEGELIILAARPGMGKTAFAMNVAENVAREDIPVLFISLEMSSIELSDRLLCSAARVNAHRLRNGTISQDDRIRLVDKSFEISRWPLFIDDSPCRTVSEIAAAARRLKRKQGKLGLIVIDYLQLIEPDNAKDPRQEQVAKIARRLKGLAREVKVPILCLAQLNRQTEAGRENIPKLSHLRESGAIEQDADVVLFVHREEYFLHGEEREEKKGQAQIIIAKQRNGPSGDALELCWLRDFTRFQDPVPERLKEFDQYNDRQMVDPSVGF